MDGADAQHSGLLRIDLAAHNRLCHQHKLRGQHDGVFARLGRRPVPAHAAYHNGQSVGAGQQGPALDRNRARRMCRVVMFRQHKVRPPEALIEMVRHHCACALNHLFGGLSNQHNGPMPIAFAGCQFARRSQQHSHVQVVSASMHHAHILALRIGRFHGRSVCEPRLFLHRQSIHVRANQQSWPRAIFQHGHNAKRLRPILILAHVLGNRVAQLAQLARQIRRRVLLVL